MLSMIQGEVVTRYGWLSPQEFTDIVAISQMTPGPIGINSATYVGFTVTGSVWGSIVATFAVVLPSFLLMLTISKFFLKYQKHPSVEAVFSGLRPAVVGLLASAALVLMNSENFSSPKEDGYILFWTAPKYKEEMNRAVQYVVYRFNDKEKVNIDDPSHIVAITRDNFYKLPYEDGKTKYRYVVTALDRLHNESKSVGKKIKL